MIKKALPGPRSSTKLGLFLCGRVITPAMFKKPPASSAKLYQILTKPCSVCHGSGWVCQTHTLREMAHDRCEDAGKPCRCNPEALMLDDD
jgi:hypothetical protein